MDKCKKSSLKAMQMNDDQFKHLLKKQIAHQIMLKAFGKYSIMRTRMKINFSSFIKGMTLSEIVLTQI